MDGVITKTHTIAGRRKLRKAGGFSFPSTHRQRQRIYLIYACINQVYSFDLVYGD